MGIIIHLYYAELAPTLLKAIDRVPAPVRLYVSTDVEAKAASIRRDLPGADVRVVRNVGRDVYPKLFAFRDAHAHHDVVLHLHGKRSPHSRDLEKWLDQIMSCLVPSTERVQQILTMFASDPKLGMVSPEPFAGILPSYGWGPNRVLAEALLWERGWGRLPHQVQFPAGSMFWARPAAPQPIFDLDLPAEAFTEGATALDGSLAHAVERLVGVAPGVAGYKQVFVGVEGRATTRRKAAG
ncbi:MAG: rhamnan synthesis F family protein [Propionibacteriaceae bacterium]|nr:rhamnan synthesis F family protein [Propionibacteriaceae bacterium]